MDSHFTRMVSSSSQHRSGANTSESSISEPSNCVTSQERSAAVSNYDYGRRMPHTQRVVENIAVRSSSLPQQQVQVTLATQGSRAPATSNVDYRRRMPPTHRVGIDLSPRPIELSQQPLQVPATSTKTSGGLYTAQNSQDTSHDNSALVHTEQPNYHPRTAFSFAQASQMGLREGYKATSNATHFGDLSTASFSISSRQYARVTQAAQSYRSYGDDQVQGGTSTQSAELVRGQERASDRTLGSMLGTGAFSASIYTGEDSDEEDH